MNQRGPRPSEKEESKKKKKIREEERENNFGGSEKGNPGPLRNSHGPLLNNLEMF